MNKPIIFISHITEEGKVAKKLKEIIFDHYRGAIDIFVSSDRESILGGTDYFNSIIDNLDKCELMITLCSPESVKRGWINFEAGYGAARKIQVIPLLYNGLEFDEISSSPIVRFQGFKMNNDDLNSILKLIDNKVGFTPTYYNFEEFIQFVHHFEKEDYSQRRFFHKFEELIGISNIKNTLLYDTEDERSMVNTTNKKYQLLEEILFEFDYEKEIELVFRGGERRNSGFEKNGFNITYSEQMREVLAKRYLLNN
ncbi:toll/interleukin-1 receptor domain-containing protein [Streptococcus agalactiae]|uniref:toll/interleukin-1 receptor domain-containing protein n=1 Tax=Streptococcus agalactiae TaxID=1311 RepID=UPI0015D928EB|nr:toll/interleukin-1 receptor domain-containing protein [Streptococcus agalactiae]HEN0123657.1 toll/interleukin-1 receptor domain-containing protein [Streptococcus agalactiae]HEO6612216.1 toll/interleukin-1 receptor domain-containing protein [Streptococcus agalactiae]HEO6628522.1 toll/interleukin-1 receptor domain-containing protein [Streptococcus agalactiae]HEO6630534.1 toll/interleukin-1 receptor domain-containing protein [Streptococcus agalactiae]HEO6649105.1 toll/interleukin-1 receptor do